jgi:enterochelin esterase family protein
LAVIELVYHDPRRSAASVKLLPDVSRELSRGHVAFARDGGDWRLRFPEPPVDRLEYRLEIRYRNGRTRQIPDPGNPLLAPNPFGAKSVLELPGYRAPDWLHNDPPRGEAIDVALHSRSLRKDIPVRLWSAAGARAGQELPLLVVHDGRDADEYGSLTLLLDHLVAAERLPPFRAALLHPVERNEQYSASTPYARALALELLPQLPAPRDRRFRVGMGVSLGALSMLHAHRRHPETFGALFLQSGSFFRPRTDAQESLFPRFLRMSRFVGGVLRGRDATPIPVTVSCGLGEENLANNRAVAEALRAQGYDVRFVEFRDAHTWVGWRDVWDPWLPELLQRAWK